MTMCLTRVAAGRARSQRAAPRGLYSVCACGLVVSLFADLALGQNVAQSPATRIEIRFNRDVRPILADNCFPCHGFDAAQRKAELRLDIAEGATALRGKHNLPAIKPGDPPGSELWKRITSADPKILMPPPESGKKLTKSQVSTLEQWIRENAVYQNHWAFEAPVRPPVPQVQARSWPRNPIDAFILAKLEGAGLRPSSEAPKETLLRRLTLDLTGLLPTLAELDAFLADTTPDAYDRAADRLLASPRYGEHMAHYWLDLARYGDTHGLHLDNERSMWLYRDWVVKAFNENLPFDQFTIWQLAGDLLPNPTREQLVASGFNRCNASTSEGGAIDEEFHVRYAVDRVETASAAWMGLTLGCAVCHDHKLDPITQKEFYQVFSIFNNMDEKAMDGNALVPPPVLKLPSPEQQKLLDEFDAKEKSMKQHIASEAKRANYTDPADLTNAPPPPPKDLVWLEDDFPAGAEVQNDGTPSEWIEAPHPVFSGKKALEKKGKGLHQVYFKNVSKPVVIAPPAKVYASVFLDPKDPPKSIMLQYHTREWSNRANWGDPDAIPYGKKETAEKTQIGDLPELGKWVRLEVDTAKLGLTPGTTVNGIAFTSFDGTVFWDHAGFTVCDDPALDPSRSFAAWVKSETAAGENSKAPKEIQELLKKASSERGGVRALPATPTASSGAGTAPGADDQQKLRAHYLEHIWDEPESNIGKARKDLRELKAKQDALDQLIPQTMISKELEKPRPAFVLVRGEYDKHGEAVSPGVPSVLPPLPPGEATNRLTFARWLVDGKHPLTARVTVNRIWQQLFGTGIVKTAEDFGAKGEWPSHPELLDWLAVELTESDWNVKALIKTIVTSASYRQDSKVTRALAQADPDNRLLARAPRFRLDAEVLRDTALQSAGLLNLKMGGRGVRTYQPPGIWEAVGYTKSDTANYTQDKGEALYRRSLYIFLKRTAPSPLMTTFDAPSREHCRARRERTNTPLQALLTLNDVQYFEAARHLGCGMLHAAEEDSERLRHGFRVVTARYPTAPELDTMLDLLTAERARYKAHPDEARKTVRVGDSPPPEDVSVEELAAYTIMGNLILNLDEAVTRN